MNMRINQSREKRCVAQVESIDACWMRDSWPSFDDSLALNEHFSRHDHFSRFNIQQTRSVHDDRARRRNLGLALRNGTQTTNQNSGGHCF